MPELGSTGLRPYSLPGVRYTAPRTSTFTPTPIAPDTTGAAILQGSAASMAGVADVLSKMPEMLQKAEQRGRTNTEARAASKYKMDKLAGGGALEDFTFGPDDSIGYKYTDPALRQLKIDEAKSSIAYRNAATVRANNTPPPGTPKPRLSPAQLAGFTSGGVPADAAVDDVQTAEAADDYDTQSFGQDTAEPADPATYGQGDRGDLIDAPPVELQPLKGRAGQLNAAVPTGVAPTLKMSSANAAATAGPGRGDLALPAGPAGGGDVGGALELMGSQNSPQAGRRVLRDLTTQSNQNAALAGMFDQAAEAKFNNQTMGLAGPAATEPLPPAIPRFTPPPTIEAPPPVPYRSKYPDNGPAYESDGADPRRVPNRPGDGMLLRRDGVTIKEWFPGGTAWKDVVDPLAKEKAEAHQLELKTIMQYAGVTAEDAANMPIEKRREIMAKAAKVQASTPEARNELTEARKRNPGLTKEAWDAMDDDKKSELLAKEAPLSPEALISEKRYISSTYQDRPSVNVMFGQKGKGIDRIKTELDGLRKSVGGDFSKLTALQQRTFIYQATKLNDPDSAVLLSEYAASADTLPAWDKAMLWLDKNKNGKQITAEQAQDIWDTVTLVHGAAKEDYLQDLPATIKAVEKIKIDPEEIGVPAKAMKWYKEKQALDRANTPISAAPGAAAAPAAPGSTSTSTSTSTSSAADIPIDKMGDTLVLQEIETALTSPDGTYQGQVITPKFRQALQAKASLLQSKLGKAQAAAARADVPKLPVVAPPSRLVKPGTRLSPADMSE